MLLCSRAPISCRNAALIVTIAAFAGSYYVYKDPRHYRRRLLSRLWFLICKRDLAEAKLERELLRERKYYYTKHSITRWLTGRTFIQYSRTGYNCIPHSICWFEWTSTAYCTHHSWAGKSSTITCIHPWIGRTGKGWENGSLIHVVYSQRYGKGGTMAVPAWIFFPNGPCACHWSSGLRQKRIKLRVSGALYAVKLNIWHLHVKKAGILIRQPVWSMM